MDKFVTRAPSWKTLNYSTIARQNALSNSSKRSSLAGKTKATKPLQDHKQINHIVSNGHPSRMSMRDGTLTKVFSQPTIGASATTGHDSAVSNEYNADMVYGNTVPARVLPSSCPVGTFSDDYVNYETSGVATTPSTNKNNSTTVDELLYENFTQLHTSHRRNLRCQQQPAQFLSSTIVQNNVEQFVEQPDARKAIINNKNTPKQAQQIMLARIQRDLNSPSALLRLRAIKAIKTPTIAPYTPFDISHGDQTISNNTMEDRSPPPLPTVTIQELMRDIIVYVEVRTGEDNRSAGVRQVISALGARVNDKFHRDTTHVVFKDGLLSTYRKAKNWNIPVVSILWIEACKNRREICDPEEFPISNVDRYENPELYDKMKRHKSMQPDSECNKRKRNKAGGAISSGTPNDSTHKTTAIKKTAALIDGTATSASNGKTDISHYFKPTSGAKSVKNSNTCVDSPATALLNRINANYFLPGGTSASTASPTVNASAPKRGDRPQPLHDLQQLTTTTNDRVCTTETPRQNKTKKTLHFGAAQPSNHSDDGLPTRAESPPQRRVSQRRLSCGVTPITIDTVVGREAATQHADALGTPKRLTRRRSFCQTASQSDLATKGSTPRRGLANDIDTIVEEEVISGESSTHTATKPPMVATRTPATKRRNTNYACRPLDISEKPNETEEMRKQKSTKRRTLYTPQKMEMSNTSVSTSVDINSIMSSNMSNMSTLLTPVASSTRLVQQRDSSAVDRAEDETLLDEASLVATTAAIPTFSSTRAPNSARRRTMFDVSMDIITHRLQTINQSAAKRITSTDASHQEVVTPLVTRTSRPVAAAPTDTPEVVLATNQNDAAAANAAPGSDHDGTAAALALPRKRKLFMPNDESFLLLTPPTLKKANLHSLAGTSSAMNFSAAKRRKSLMPLSQPQSRTNLLGNVGDGSDLDAAKPVGDCTERLPAARRRRSTMDFVDSQAVKKPISAAAVKVASGDVIADIQQQNQADEQKVEACAINSQPTDQGAFVVNEVARRETQSQWPCLVYTNMHKEQVEVIREAVDKLGGFRLEKTVSENTTHVISLESRRTLNMLRALVRGLWILDYNWLVDSMKAGNWLGEEHYEMRHFSRAVEICRTERQAFRQHYRCELFTELEPFYVSTRCSVSVTPHDLIELISLCGGRVVDQRKRAKFILRNTALVRNEKNTDATDPKVYVTPLWLLDSITQMQLVRYDRYVPPKTKEAPAGVAESDALKPPPTQTLSQGPATYSQAL